MKTAAGELTPWGQEIQDHLDRLHWSRNELARRADLDSGNLSKMMRGLQPVTHETAEAVADALKVDVLRLKELAGLRVIAPPTSRDSRVEYIAQRMMDLPPDAREKAIEALGIQLDTIYELVMGEPGRRSVQVGTGDAEARLREGKKTLTDALDEVKELTLEQRALIEAFAAELGPDHPDLPHQVALLVRAVARTQESSAPTE